MSDQQHPRFVLDGPYEALRGASGVHTLTDDGHEEILVTSRRIAAQIAAALDTTLYLVDRSQRTWTDTPHVRGPLGLDEFRSLGVDHMIQQIEEAQQLGAPSVLGIAPSMPNWDFFDDGLHVTQAGVVVAPCGLDHPRVLDRLQGYDDVEDRVLERIGDRHLIVVENDGTHRLASKP